MAQTDSAALRAWQRIHHQLGEEIQRRMGQDFKVIEQALRQSPPQQGTLPASGESEPHGEPEEPEPPQTPAPASKPPRKAGA